MVHIWAIDEVLQYIVCKRTSGLFMDCFNRSTCGIRYLFHVTGYSEFSISDRRRLIIAKKMLLCQVPQAVRDAIFIRLE